MDTQGLEAASSENSAINVRRFVSAQRRYDNLRVRDSEISKRLCYDCGEIVCGGEREYQEHILVHEAVYLAYQLYHYEDGQRNFSLTDSSQQSSQTSCQSEKQRESLSLRQDKSPKESIISRSGEEAEDLGVVDPSQVDPATPPIAQKSTVSIQYDNRFIPDSSSQLLTTVIPMTIDSTTEAKQQIAEPVLSVSETLAEDLSMETERAVSSIEDWMLG